MDPREYHHLAELEDQHWWYAGMRASARALLTQLALPRPARILDAGCGTGGGLRWLAEFGQPHGVDWHPLAVHYARRAAPRVARASIQTLPFPDATFDLVTSFDVLYHLAVADDAAALRECARVLRPGGWLLVRVPAHDWLRGAHDRYVHTRHRYAAPELRAKLTAARLTVARLTPLAALLFPAAVLRRQLQSADSAQTDVQLPAGWLNQLLTMVLSWEALWLRGGNLPFGLSLAALAQKPPAD